MPDCNFCRCSGCASDCGQKSLSLNFLLHALRAGRATNFNHTIKISSMLTVRASPDPMLCSFTGLLETHMMMRHARFSRRLSCALLFTRSYYLTYEPFFRHTSSLFISAPLSSSPRLLFSFFFARVTSRAFLQTNA
jgi:hypothetical protein